jgi:hypothetical protein
MKLKRGDTFKLSGTVLGDALPIVGGISAWVIRSQLRDIGGQLIDTFICTIIDPVAGTYTIEESVAGVTKDWPTGSSFMDIEYTIDGEVVSTENIPLTVTKDQTI